MFRRQSTRNPWRNTRNDVEIPWNRIFAWIFVVVMPLSILFISMNIILRVPNSYASFLTRSEAMREVPFQVTEEEVVDTFALYMQHRASEFSLQDGVEYKPQPVFGQRDKEAIHRLRKFADLTMALGLILFIFSLAIFIRLFVKGQKELLYFRMADSRVVMLALVVLLNLAAFVPKVRTGLLRVSFGVKFPPGDVLSTFVDCGMVQCLSVMVSIVCIIWMVLLGYISWKLLAEKKLFQKRDEF